MSDVDLYARYFNGEISMDELKRLLAQKQQQQSTPPPARQQQPTKVHPNEWTAWVNPLLATTLTHYSNSYDKDGYSSGGYRETTKYYFYNDRSYYYSREFFMSLDTYSSYNDYGGFGPSLSSSRSSKTEDRGRWTVLEHEKKPVLVLFSNEGKEYYYYMRSPETGVLFLGDVQYYWQKMG